MTGTLYITATPIGNLEDITLRALRILREADFIACEDTRNTIRLLNHFDIHTPLVSYHKYSTEKETDTILSRIENGESCALATDAGTPCISDPGCRLVELALERNIHVESLPGACAFITALTLSGFDTQKGFMFAGFAPRKASELTAFLNRISVSSCPVGIYEAPGRVKKTLAAIAELMPQRVLCLSRELTKLHEENTIGTADEVLAAYSERDIKGEAVIIIEASAPAPAEKASPEEALGLLRELMQSGISRKDAIRQCADRTGLSKNEVYRLALDNE